MIRPITCLAFLLACGSGLYLYQSKHRVKVIDEEIAQTVHATDALREQTRMLSAEWTLLNDPERLRQLANQYLALQTVSPNQFTSLADLDARLPPPLPQGAPSADAVVAAAAAAAVADSGGAAPADAAGTGARLADAAPAAKDAVSRDAAAGGLAGAGGKGAAARDAAARDAATRDVAAKDAARPAPPRAVLASADPHAADRTEHRGAVTRVAVVAPLPRVVALQRPAEHREQAYAEQRPVMEPRPSETRGYEPRPYEQRGDRAMASRPLVAARVAAPMPQAGGSMLGMAHGAGVGAAAPAPMPLPRPMPVSAPQWTYNSGG
jgi:hypothetical protein